MGLDIYLHHFKNGAPANIHDLEDFDCETVEIPSVKYPDHYFKIGYFRSSYNSAGYNRIAGDYGLASIYDIFGVNGEDYHPVIDLAASRERAEVALSAMKARSEEVGSLRIEGMPSSSMLRNQCPKNSAEALAIFEKEMKGDGFKVYSSGLGMFWRESKDKIRAVIPGTGFLGPQIYIVLEGDEPVLDRYIKATEIMIETIDWVLSRPHPENYRFAWSG